jgi:endonuclease/exonuclease/phosphatase family metal-dependent hydrolase
MLALLSHNAYWFQGHPFEGTSPGAPDPRVLAALARIYRRLAPALVCLQEVQSDAAFHAVAEAMGADGSYRPGGALPQYGVASLWGIDGCRPLPVTRRTRPQRQWQALELPSPDGGDPITVCNCHLPSARQLPKDAAARRRIAEMTDVLDAATPHVVLGDLNEPPGGPVGRLMSDRGYHDAAVLTGRHERPTSLGPKRGDYIWVHDAIRHRLAEYGVLPRCALAAAEAGKLYLSDHLPLWIRLTTEGTGP